MLPKRATHHISSLSYNIDDLAPFVLNCRKRPRIIGISECRLRANQQSLPNISLQNYTYELTSTESLKGGTLIYIDQNVKHKIRKDLKLYKSKEIESTFLEIIENNQKNVIVGCIYKHPGAAIQEFTILNSDVDNQTSNFLDTMYSNSFFPTINTPTHI